jgi:hypothetical protein
MGFLGRGKGRNFTGVGLRKSASVTIQEKGGKVIAKNLNQKDAAKLTENFLNSLKK